MNEYVVHYEAKNHSGKKTVGSRLISAPNPGTAEDRLIRRLQREGNQSVTIIGTQRN